MLSCPVTSGPLATLAGVYQDVNGRQLEAVWREVVLLWTDRLVEVLPALLGNPQLRPLVQTSITALSGALDVVRNLHCGNLNIRHFCLHLVDNFIDICYSVCKKPGDFSRFICVINSYHIEIVSKV